MIDFLNQRPYVTREEYMWQWTIPQIRLASVDYSHIEHLSEEEAKRIKAKKNEVKYEDPKAFASALGIPII